MCHRDDAPIGLAHTLHTTKDAPARALDRRRLRSDDPITALHYQLSHARREARLDALVLVDESGCLIAGAGAWPACEELAAYAPLFGDPFEPLSAVPSTRIAEIDAQVETQRVEIDGFDALLCGRGGGEGRSATIERAAEGCRRILGCLDA